MKNVTLHELGQLTGTNYHVLKELLASVPFTPGPNRAHIYNSVEAIRAIYTTRPPTTLEDAKLRSELLNAQLKEVELAKKTKDLIPAGIAFGLINLLIKYIAGKLEDLRAHGKIDRDFIARCESRWTELYQEFVRDYDFNPASHPPPEASQTPQEP